ncbi:MAG: hypothetical protein ACSLE9_07885 [Burkholderiaceae bacterium]
MMTLTKFTGTTNRPYVRHYARKLPRTDLRTFCGMSVSFARGAGWHKGALGAPTSDADCERCVEIERAS